MIAFFLRQFTLALTSVTGILLVGEILMPGLVLPFLNLHLFVVATLFLNLLPLEKGEHEGVWKRVLPVVPVGLVLIAYAFLLLFGMGPSAMLLGVGLSGLIIAAIVAIK